jgi:hypothetical protein
MALSVMRDAPVLMEVANPSSQDRTPRRAIVLAVLPAAAPYLPRERFSPVTLNGPRAALGAEFKNYEFEERLTLRGWIVSPRRSMAKSSVVFAARFSAVFAW